MKQLEEAWYSSSLTALTFCLLPLSWIFGCVVRFRRFLYQNNFKKSFQFSKPVIIVGNITVGGTGKTPFVIWLASFLKEKGLTPGIVSRGVGGNLSKTPRFVNDESDVREVGDEAMLLQKTHCPVVIGIDRVACVQKLFSETPCDVVICDDGLQHYRLKRKIEIALIDGERALGNQELLPAGPLREKISRLQEVDLIVCQGDHANFLEKEMLSKIFLMKQQSGDYVSLKNMQQKAAFETPVHAVTAIGHPKRFFDSLRFKSVQVIEHVFKDHYLFKKEDFDFGDHLPIVMTEKDAVKCRQFADERFWFLPTCLEVGQDLGEKIFALLNR